MAAIQKLKFIKNSLARIVMKQNDMTGKFWPFKGTKFPFKIGSLITYNYLYSNEEDKTGVVCEIKKDSNFGAIVSVLCGEEVISIPYSIMELKKID